MAFHVGQKVVCVDPLNVYGVSLVKGEIYTIRGFSPRVLPIDGDGIYLEEIRLPKRVTCGNEHSFSSHRFRPVQKRKTDISIFKRMLTPTGVDA